MDRSVVVKKMAAHLDNEVNKVRYEEDWEPERIADERHAIVFEGYAHCTAHDSFDPACVWCASAEHNMKAATGRH
jgi:hypothetical protein